jgi:hypothetical protein
MPSFQNDALRNAVEQYTRNAISRQATSESPHGVSTQEIVDKLHGQLQSATLRGAASLRDMDYDYELMAVYDRLQEYEPVAQIAAAYAGERRDELGDINGADALRKLLFRHAYDAISQRDDDSMVARFNGITSDWPHVLRARLASYEYARGRNGEYEQKLYNFAEAEGWLDMTFEQTELSHFYDDNPFDDDSLSEREAKLVMLCRVRDMDEHAVIDGDIGDYESLEWWLGKADTAEAALRAHRFGTDVPAEVIEHAASPDDWEVLDPHSFPRRECTNCGSDLYQIEPHNNVGEPEWFVDEMPSDSIEPCSVYNVGSARSVYYDPRADDDALFCQQCVDNSRPRDPIQLSIITPENHVRVSFHSPLIKHEGDERLADCSTDVQRRVKRLYNGDSPAAIGMVRIQLPNAAASAPNYIQEDIMRSVFGDNITDIRDWLADSGTVIFEGGQRSAVLFPQDNIQAAQRVKNMLDNADEVVA